MSSVSSPSPQSLAPSPYRVLFVGSIFNRRHVTDLIRAFAPIARAHPGASLDIVGDNRSYPRRGSRARRSPPNRLGTQVRWHEYVTDAATGRAVRRGSRLCVSVRVRRARPDAARGAGGRRSARSAGHAGRARELRRARQSTFPPGDLPATTRALESLLFDEAARQRVLAAAPAELAKYSWPRAARETLAVIETAGSG